MKTVTAIVIMASFIMLSACKEGCTEETAINYDSKVKYDDGTCIYYADAWKGNYVGAAIDTFYYLDTIVKVERAISFKIYNNRPSNNNLYFESFLQAYNYPTSIPVPNDTAFDYTESFYSPMLYTLYLRLSNDTLYFTSTDVDTNAHELVAVHHGYGVKQ